MAFYELVDMNRLRVEEKRILENIYLIINQQWNYEESEETEKLIAMFENSEEIISRFLAIKEIDIRNKKAVSLLNLTEKEKKLGIIENPEEWCVELAEKEYETVYNVIKDPIGKTKNFNEVEQEKVMALAMFVLKMAVYRFCMVHLPKITKKSVQKTIFDETKVEILKIELESWEEWIWLMYEYIRNEFSELPLLSDRIKCLRSIYAEDISEAYRGFIEDIYKGRIEKSYIECIEKAYKDEDTFEKVKNLRWSYCGENEIRTENINGNEDGKKIAEIESMRKMLDMMEKQIKGDLTVEDVGELKRNAIEWGKDMQSLMKIISKL